MAAGFMLRDCKDFIITNPYVEGWDVGIDVADSEGVKVINGTLETRVGVKGERVKQIEIKNVFHDERAWIFRLAPLAFMVRRALYGDV
ncbi:hypothetical protein [Pseudomonas thivervalensis]|uniref:hypothetical protein n=1 Tax=Pseudomonas thivervalensis TaxID=86265 RepID=UPI00069F0AFD|nr:hypothetical protein [Pseudomonas thivervalensis]